MELTPEQRAADRAAIAKRKDEELVRLSAQLGLFVPGRLIGELAVLDADGRPNLCGRSSYDVIVDMRLAMDRDTRAAVRQLGRRSRRGRRR